MSRRLRSRTEQDEVSGVTSDLTVLQEMLKRQMASVRHRTTTGVENDRLQQVLQQQLEMSKYQTDVVIGENGRYHAQIAASLKGLDDRTGITKSDVVKLEQVVNSHMSDINTGLTLPAVSKWNEPGNVRRVLDCIERVCRDTVILRETARQELGALEGELSNQQSGLRIEIKRLERDISMKQQHLQEIQTAISDEQLAIKDDKRRFLLAIRPKKAKFEQLQGRQKLLNRT
jgi:hypothetical protein